MPSARRSAWSCSSPRAIAVGTFFRFYLVSWLGERVSADLRSAVFRNLVRLHPGFFEDNRSGEIMSRLTADTTVLQTIIGSSMSMALRSALTLTGAVIMMLITNLKLTLIIVAVVPLVLLPIMIFGRRVRKPCPAQPGQRRQRRLLRRGDHPEHPHGAGLQPRGRESAGLRRARWSGPSLIARSRVRQRALLVAAAILVLSAAWRR
jgi:ATP-binding cassette subfamily B protein